MFVSTPSSDRTGERVVESRERLRAVGAACDDLGDHRVVVAMPTRLPVSTADRCAPSGAGAHDSTAPVAGRKPRAGLSAYTRASIA